jgi:predicted MFS family arabinose efflux permease
MATSIDTAPGTFRGVFAVREFRALWLAEFLSLMGDQLTRIALSVLVFSRTGSAVLTGLTYALTYIPTVVGSFTLSNWADRRPRRSVIITIDSVRALVVIALALPGIPLPWLYVIVAIMSFLGGPRKAAHLALLRDVLSAGQYAIGTAVRHVTIQMASLVGLAVGGVLVAVVSPGACFTIDAASFAASALLVRGLVRLRPAAAATTGDSLSVLTGLRVVLGEPRRQAVFLTTTLGLFLMAPASLAAPFVAQLGHGPAMVALVLASGGAGSIIGVPLFTRLVPAGRWSIAFPICGLTAGVPLILIPAHGGIYIALGLFAVSEAIWSIQVVMAVSFLAELLPDRYRAQGMGLAGSMNATTQGLGAGLAGLVAQATGPTVGIALAGAASVLVALVPSWLWIMSLRRPTDPTAHDVTEGGPQTSSAAPTAVTAA